MEVDVKRLISVLNEAESFSLSEMNSGLRYLYEEVYLRLSRGDVVSLSEIAFSNFDSEDLESLFELYQRVLEDAEFKVDRLINMLHGSQPVAIAVAFA